MTVFTVTFDQFNTSLLNTVINLFIKNLTDPKLLNSNIIEYELKSQAVNFRKLIPCEQI